ncbi:MAG: hypothetical protein ACE5H7_00470 [Acidiferrobacterales bacterium]
MAFEQAEIAWFFLIFPPEQHIGTDLDYSFGQLAATCTRDFDAWAIPALGAKRGHHG